MIINGQKFHTIWSDGNNQETVKIIDQQKLPFEFSIKTLKTFSDSYTAIKDMTVRGAPLIGVTAAYGIYLALCNYNSEIPLQKFIHLKCDEMKTARPTAVNLAFAVDEMKNTLKNIEEWDLAKQLAFKKAEELKQLEIDYCNSIGNFGVQLIEELSKKKKGETVNILTHCNAGWLACIDWGTATAPIYKAHEKGINIHVWVDETRPRNQGSKLTAFELSQMGVDHTVITDNTGGHLMQHGMVDLVVVGSDRTTRTGDVCNKIGTYLKALAAFDNNVPFYVALPSSSFDFSITDGIKEIPIEKREANEVKFMEGKGGKAQVVPDGSKIANYGFDVTPARLVTGIITEKGICNANEEGISTLFKK
ncbi:MAG: S-methyl-5-thioribose-1-phosphate isomerase [Prolixibacteraceae bacterium]|jgi:methylthioribose-1-phosphate isomerase|nr:S-methyl-5-thioribose-1-phosphate isomerase [Prolixibacteraceae bacterium]